MDILQKQNREQRLAISEDLNRYRVRGAKTEREKLEFKILSQIDQRLAEGATYGGISSMLWFKHATIEQLKEYLA